MKLPIGLIAFVAAAVAGYFYWQKNKNKQIESKSQGLATQVTDPNQAYYV